MKKDVENVLNKKTCEDLLIKIQRMYNRKSKVKRIMQLEELKALKDIPGKHFCVPLLRTAITGRSHNLRNVLNKPFVNF